MSSARFLSCALLLAGSLAAAAPATPVAHQLLRGLPLRFEANAGQWNPSVHYAARAAGYRLFLTTGEAVLAFDRGTVGIAFDGADASAGFEPAGKSTGVTQYIRGPRSQWRTGVPSYERVVRRGVYPGIDVVYYGAGAEFEYDFVLAPHADPKRIRLSFRGADALSLTPDGDLAIEKDGARLVQKKPVVYQRDASGARREVAARYRLLARHAAAVEVGDYDRSRELTIDPTLSYASLIGGSGSDGVTAVQVDSRGRVYVAGYIQNNDLQGPENAFAPSNKGAADGFLAIIDPSKAGADSLVYFTYLGGSNGDRINAMAVDAAGVAYLTGTTTSFDFPRAGNGVQQGMGGTDAADAFVVKLDPRLSGTDAVLYSTFLGGTLVDEGLAIAVDPRGIIHVAGATRSENFPVTPSAYAGVRWGAQDAFLVRINPDSDSPLLYSTFFGAENSDSGLALVLGGSGIVYMAGVTTGGQLPQAGAMYRDSNSGATDVFLTRWDLDRFGTASLDYSTYIGGSGVDEVRGMSLDASGRVLLTGYTLSPDFPLTDNAYGRTNRGAGDVFVVRFDVNAPRQRALDYSTYFGGSGGDVAYSIAPSGRDTVWLTGYTLSPDFPVTAAALQSSPVGGIEVFVTSLDLSKEGGEGLAFSTYLGDVGVNVGYALAATSDGTVYVGGQSARRTLPTTASGYQVEFGGGLTDGFVLVIGK